MEAFQKALKDTRLGDLGFVGDVFTWQNNWHMAEGYVRERLDHAVANFEWRCLFPLYKIINGDPHHSDHRPITVILSEQAMPRYEVESEPSFQFEAAWLQEDDCVEVVEEAWNSALGEGEIPVAAAVKEVGRKLWLWDKEVLGPLRIASKRRRRRWSVVGGDH
jgi:hypothetical protein